MVLIDPPLWPAHGTVWGHVVSTTSLDELHAFAARAGIPRRAFDADHYDYPVDRQSMLTGLGATLVSTRELIERLRASGLRVTAAQRRGPSV